MRGATPNVLELLAQLEQFYGSQQAAWPTDPYEFLLWWHCGYPASDRNCARGWEQLNQQIGIKPERILEAGVARLSRALKAGGMVAELRAQRVLQIASRAVNEFGGDLRAGLRGPIPAIRKTLKKFPNIGDPGADRILLFGGISPVAAVPSNCPQVLARMVRGRERETYNAQYSEAQELLEDAVPRTFDARQRAFLLLKCHGQSLCKRSAPRCDGCPVRSGCAFTRQRL
ncbi:MAG: hypothetical protein JOZ22_12125 [Acidobacteriia bacterium]|nr:hypothetical protein [Terriglobia bacterium]